MEYIAVFMYIRNYYYDSITTAGLPIFQKHPQDQFVHQNDKVTFECFANGSDSLTITWEKDRTSYTSGVTQVTTYITTQRNGVSSSLTLNGARITDSGNYRCKATNVDLISGTSEEAKLLSKLCYYVYLIYYFFCSTVLPRITINPTSVTIPIGQSKKLVCKARGTKVDYRWIKDGVAVSGNNSRTLRITNIEESDEGVYKCVAFNEGGQVESNPATITVYGEYMCVLKLEYSHRQSFKNLRSYTL